MILNCSLRFAMAASNGGLNGSHFNGVDRTVFGFEGLEAAQNVIKTNEQKDAFAADYKYLSKLSESLSPDNILDLYLSDYKWLSQNKFRNGSCRVAGLLWWFGKSFFSSCQLLPDMCLQPNTTSKLLQTVRLMWG
ncbi:MAG: hypothetical protein ACKO7P_14595 [Bacteroidota bacterium]